jgi:hypothetical protein
MIPTKRVRNWQISEKLDKLLRPSVQYGANPMLRRRKTKQIMAPHASCAGDPG